MKRFVLIISLFTICLICVTSDARAQGKPVLGPDASTVRDPDLEKDDLHNLEVARQYFKLKKAYYASLDRTEEIIAGNPNFAKIDEALYIAGMSSLYLSENRGKQKIAGIPEKKRLKPEEYRGKAREYLSQLVNEHPDSSFSKQVQDALHDLGGVLPKTQ
ncbi:MAG TPA: outer membrane protein assembly factor BamD [Pyrinomonadaceae bacterium]|nr:outer membrane protein assembly factor BamD [Pyrinomonadaceae bacterium]